MHPRYNGQVYMFIGVDPGNEVVHLGACMAWGPWAMGFPGYIQVTDGKHRLTTRFLKGLNSYVRIYQVCTYMMLVIGHDARSQKTSQRRRHIIRYVYFNFCCHTFLRCYRTHDKIPFIMAPGVRFSKASRTYRPE